MFLTFIISRKNEFLTFFILGVNVFCIYAPQKVFNSSNVSPFCVFLKDVNHWCVVILLQGIF